MSQPAPPGGGSTNCNAAGLLAELETTNYIAFECSGTITLTNPIVITGEVTLDATDRNVTLNGNNTSRLFIIQPGARLTLINLVLTGGKATQGGAIRNEGHLFATNCVFAGNNAIGANGAKGADGEDDNTNPSDGENGHPGTSGLGGAIWNDQTLVLTRCTFSTNSARGGNGGAGGKGGNGINGSFYSGDGGDGGFGAVGRGGAIFNANYARITECIFQRNNASGGDGGAFGAGGTGGQAGKPGRGGQGAVGSGAAIHNVWYCGVSGSTFSENRAEGGDSANTAGQSDGDGNTGVNGAEGWGGGICNVSVVDLINSTFSTNRVFGGKGGKGADGSVRGGRGGNGGAAFGGNFFNNNGQSAITNCTFAGGAALGGTNGVGGGGPTPGTKGTVGANRGGNLARVGGTLALKNTIVCRPGTGANGFGAVVDMGNNISSDNSIALNSGSSFVNTLPRMGGLADNEGFTRTFALLSDSVAVDAGADFESPEIDQRGFPVHGARRDIGAYEFAASSIEVTVTDVDGTPIQGVLVTIGSRTNTTDADGFADFPPLPAGDYTITPTHPLYTFEPPSETVTLGPLAEVVFTARRTFSISGFVSDGVSGINNVTVTAGSEEATTGTNGFYEIKGLDPGIYTVEPSADGYAFVPSLRQVDLQADTTNVNFSAAGMHSISGRITESGRGLANVTVRAGNRSATTGPTGDYTITEVPQRQQIVTPSLFGYSFNPSSHTLVPIGNENGIDFVAFASYQVAGLVRHSSNGLGANAVTVTLTTNFAQPGPPPAGSSTILLTDTNGNFAFTNIRGGSYVLTLSRPGHGFAPPGTNLTLGPSVTGLVYEMFPALSISGRLTVGGSGISNATVLLRTNSGPVIATNTTAVNGTYAFSGLSAGSYLVVPPLDQYDFTPTNRLVTLTASSNNLDFTANGFSIRGAVTNNGVALADVTVRAGSAVSLTDSAGRYALTNLPPGTYVVTLEKFGYAFQPTNAVVTVGPNRTDLNFQAAQVFTINGEVMELGTFPLIGARITAGGVSAVTVGGGRYTLSGVPGGSDVVVTASMPGYEFSPAQQTIVLDGVKHGVNFSARGLSVISGRVTNAVPAPGRLPGVGSVKVNASGRYEATTRSSDGTYTITNVGPGVHTLIASRAGFGFDPASRVITVVTNTHTNNVNFAAFTSWKLFGRITLDGTTNGIRGVNVRAVGDFSTNDVITDIDGRYTFPALRAGNYKLFPTLAGHGFEPRSYDHSDPGFRIALGADFQQNFVGFDGFRIDGRVTDRSTGRGIGGLAMKVSTPQEDISITDTNGNYSFSGLREGDYTVTPPTPGYEFTPPERVIGLGPTNATAVNFVAQANLVVSGRVLEAGVGISNIQIRLTGTNLSRTTISDHNGNFAFTNLPPTIVTVQPTEWDLFTPINAVLNPALGESATFTFSAGAGRLTITRSNNAVRLNLRALPTRIYTLQTNGGGTGPWNNIAVRATDSNGNLEYFHTNAASPPTLLFRSRR